MDTDALYQFDVAPSVAQEDVEGMFWPLRPLLQHPDVPHLEEQYGCIIKSVFDLQISCSPCNSCLLSAVCVITCETS